MIKQESRAYFKALGAHVTTLRKAQGMTQAELARAIGVSQQAVFAYELGSVASPSSCLPNFPRYSRPRSRISLASPSPHACGRGDCLRDV